MAFDKKYAKRRSSALRGSFLGYQDGVVVSKILSDEERLKKKIDKLSRRYDQMYAPEKNAATPLPDKTKAG